MGGTGIKGGLARRKSNFGVFFCSSSNNLVALSASCEFDLCLLVRGNASPDSKSARTVHTL
eukprot:scaffold14884_cov455-Alexandrium_tamarense.AAC.1